MEDKDSAHSTQSRGSVCERGTRNRRQRPIVVSTRSKGVDLRGMCGDICPMVSGCCAMSG